MQSSLIHAFFVGRAIAEVAYEKLEDSFTNTLSELGKFDAEQREQMRKFTEEVLARAETEERKYTQDTSTSTSVVVASEPADLQETIDELRADIARVRAEIQVYRS